MDRKERAVEYKHDRNNCAQAVLLAYQDEVGIPEETLKKLGAGLGLGMGTMNGTCGALNGAAMILGMLESDGWPITSLAKELQESFKEKAGAVLCRDLKGVETGAVLCSCDDCVRNAVAALEEFRPAEKI